MTAVVKTAAIVIPIDGQNYEIDDVTPTGRQLRDDAGLSPASAFILILIEGRGARSIGLDEMVDLRTLTNPLFRSFENDRIYTCTLNERGFEWGDEAISDVELRTFGEIPSEHELLLDSDGDRVIEPGTNVRLKREGVERIISRKPKKFKICVEGDFLPWPKGTITTEEIAEIGGWDVSIGVIEVDEDQNERTLKPGEIIKLRPGLSYGKKLCFKRGA